MSFARAAAEMGANVPSCEVAEEFSVPWILEDLDFLG